MTDIPTVSPGRENKILAAVLVPPHEMQAVFVGEYESRELVPKVTTVAQADGWDKIGWTPSRRVMKDGSIRLTVMVQNFTDQPVAVHVYQDDEGL